MNPTSAPTLVESSLLLWALGALVAVLTAHVALGWLRMAQLHVTWRLGCPALLAASAVLGSGLCAAMVVSMAAEALAFELGFRTLAAAGLWVVATAACAPVVALVWWRPALWARLVGGVLLAGVALMTQMGWIWAAGFRPGVQWRAEYVLVAGMVMAIGFTTALLLSYSSAGTAGHTRHWWRLGAATLLGLSLLAGQELLMAGAGLRAQVGSAYQHELPGTALSLVAGVLVPLALGMMALDLASRRQMLRAHARDASSTLNLPQRRKRRHRIHRI